MSNFAAQLKTEISRIAKKESRTQSAVLKKAQATHRAEIADLKRRIASLEAVVRRLAKTPTRTITPVKEETEPQSLRFRADGFASLRKKFGLSAVQMAQLLGVSNQSVYHWEAGKSKPRAAQLQAIAAVRKLGKKEVTARLAQMSTPNQVP
ncbi:helix-turn-helix domain-containing protein [Limnohabitans sp. 63ED37-2]|uniref:helix-turn-helix domain-containing protein n=1 Tax=Limnohabitans sp. 63ED37-2 TaxID=1678128 RepID=UPI0007068855|nr:helix-turn-helix transcriptional regulator [Limnohabitans sp. 63ED37-2]ALK88933.1 putative transcriptional regulator [Limnohabitans sp. 63ED37-2]